MCKDGEGVPGVLGEGGQTHRSEHRMVHMCSAESLTQIVRECAGVLWRENHARGPCESIISICVCMYRRNICVGKYPVPLANTGVWRASVQYYGCMGVISNSSAKQFAIM